MARRSEPSEYRALAFEAQHRSNRAAGKCVREHPPPVPKDKPWAVQERAGEVLQLDPAFCTPSKKLDVGGADMFRSHDCGGAVVVRNILVDDEPAIAELFGHRRAWIRRRML